ncbi:MAG: NIPSNAP family protein [Pseudomonadota bacterium]|nr:NIPSNAP family protein [Pseudomonadota bacterium]
MKKLWAGCATLMMAAVGVSAAVAADEPVAAPHPVLELRQYKIVAGKREAWIPLFEREFIETQEVLGMRLVGQFRERDDPNRFVWLREFPDMTTRAKQLTDFYFGPVWKAHRDEANPYLDDNDDVLLLRPAAPGDNFAMPTTPRVAVGAPPQPHGLVVAHILYLWKDPTTGFASFFDSKVKPALEAAGLPVIGVFVPETVPNNFPRLPVRQNEKLLVWFTRVSDQAAYDRAWHKATQSDAWQTNLAPTLTDAQERAPQLLHLSPTPRSALQ